MDRSSNKVGLLHDTFQIGIRFVVFFYKSLKKKHAKFGLQHCKADNFSKYIFKQYAITIHV